MYNDKCKCKCKKYYFATFETFIPYFKSRTSYAEFLRSYSIDNINDIYLFIFKWKKNLNTF